MDVMERLWARVDRTDPAGCWVWLGAKNDQGYGQIREAGKTLYVHRLTLAQSLGRPLGDGLHVDHMCHRPLCVNPLHLREITHAQNQQNRKGARLQSRSGVQGVRWVPHAGRFRVEVSGKHIGYFSTLEAGAQAATAARKTLMPFSRDALAKEFR